MTTLFSFPMDSIMRVVLGAFIVVAVLVAALAIRNRLFFKLGLRNIPRRRAQSVLIIVGLMLSTVIITSAFVAGDTFSYSIRSSAATSLGGVDEMVQGNIVKEQRGRTDSGSPYIPAATVASARSALAGASLTDGITGAIVAPAPSQDLTSRQTKVGVDLVAISAGYPAAFGSLVTTGGTPVSLAHLPANQIYLNDLAAQDLNAHAGNRLLVYIGGRPHAMTVRAIVRNQGPAGGGLLSGGTQADPTVLMPLARAQQLTGHPGQITAVLISNRGDSISGASLTHAVVQRLNASSPGYPVNPVKHDRLQDADQAGTDFTSGFVAFGLFSIAAGVMLIFLIFVMLAAERRSEMGIARAVGTQRSHLIQQFLFEGYVYDLGAAIVGIVIGLLVGLAMASILGVLANNSGFFQLQRHVELRSIIVAFCIGALITFITIVISCWRVSRLNIVAAIRDLPDDLGRDGGIGAAFGRPLADLRAAGLRIRRGRVFGAARATIAAPWHFLLAFRVFISRGPLLLLCGYLLFRWGVDIKQLFPFSLGISLLLVGAAMILRWSMGGLRVPDRVCNRIGYSLAGMALVVYWLLPFDFFRSDLELGVEMFVLSGIMLTLGGVWVVMFNIDILLGAFLAVTGGVGRLAPVLKAAVTYPMQHRLRTGMTLFMFSLVMFALTVQAVIIGSFSSRGLNLDRDTGGYQIVGQVDPSTPIRNLGARIASDPSLRGRITGYGSSVQIGLAISQVGNNVTELDPVSVVDDSFLASTRFTLHSRATGYTSDRQVWQAMRRHPGYVVVSAAVVKTTSTRASQGFKINGFTMADSTFRPVRIQLDDPRTGTSIPVTVIGVVDSSNAPLDAFNGFYVSRATVQAAGDVLPLSNTFYFRVAPGQNVHQVTLALGSAFVRNGLDLTEAQAAFNSNASLEIGFNNLLEGFMALGLIVGIAALGVLATRAVVERRQQIGMLRAIGFRRRMVQATFLLESSFVAILGALIGVILGTLLGIQVIDYFAKQQPDLHPVIPWSEMGLIVLGAYLASLLTTFLPAWQASRVQPAEALRYE